MLEMKCYFVGKYTAAVVRMIDHTSDDATFKASFLYQYPVAKGLECNEVSLGEVT